MKPRKPRLPIPEGGEIVLYQTEDGRTRIDCRFEERTIWLTQAQIAELFQITPQNVTLHLKAIFAEGELAEAATCKDYLQVRQEGERAVTRNLRHYRLDWKEKLDQFLRFNERNVLPGVGRISREQADELAREHYTRFEQRRRTAVELEAEQEAVKQLTETAKKLPAGRQKGGKA